MVLAAVRENRPMVVTDPAQRQDFVDDYVGVVLAAFDDAERVRIRSLAFLPYPFRSTTIENRRVRT